MFFYSDAICYIWHSQFVFNVLILMSLWHTVLLSFERYIVVLMPFKANALSSMFYRIPVTSILTIIMMCSIIPNFYFVKYDSINNCQTALEISETLLKFFGKLYFH